MTGSTPSHRPEFPSLPPDLEQALLAILDLPESERDEAVARLIRQHPQSADAIRRWLHANSLLGTLHDGPGGNADGTPQRIGPYQILESLGEGGMGAVFLAEQKEPVRRRVALKVIKRGMDSKQVLARFELERQALAVMNHPAIAKVFDAGITEQGQPYFVMELVEGKPLTDYCDEHRLTLKERIDVFQQICRGVQHAHQKGVLHRDLKPGNILVSRKDDQHLVKIIDFGLARATDQQLVAQTIFTEQGQLIGTPEYMSPEQAGGNALEIDTRTDIYSLGVILYELLSGEQPFPSAELRRAGLLEMQRIIREREPQKPSTKITSIGEKSSAVAARRRLAPGTLLRHLRGELDWIVLRAMAKEPERRYATPLGLALDLGRYLEHEPVEAGPPSAAYRVRKLLRRYRGQALAASAVLVTAVGGAVVAWNYAITASANETRANDKAREALDEKGRADRKATEALEQKQRAEDQRTRADQTVSEFNQLAGRVRYDRVVRSERDLYPAWPDKIPAMEAWQRDECEPLLNMRQGISDTVRSLRKKALPATEQDLQEDRQSHPRYGEWQQLGQRLASLQRAQSIRTGMTALVEPELTAEQQALTPDALKTLAWDRVAPEAAERKIRGEEALGLACAQGAAAKAKGTAGAYQILDTLAWARLANGQDAEALEQSRAALAAAPADKRQEYEGYLAKITRAIEDAAAILAQIEKDHAQLTATVAVQRTWRFAPKDEAARFLHDTLVELSSSLDSLETNQKAALELRLRWARWLRDGLTLQHPHARHTWAEVRAAIAASERYAGQKIELRDQDVVGLVPIGMNPKTMLWEFYELRSAWNGKDDPRRLPIPWHEPDGSIAMTGETGIVFVLLPGGTFTMGAQKENPNGPNFDAAARSYETPHEVTLAPFFLSRYELTQGQWARLWTGAEKELRPSTYKAGANVAGRSVTLANPVERVDWEMCNELVTRHGLVLPTEAQWEYGCRAGTTTPWVCALEELRRYANVADATAKAQGVSWPCESWADGFAAHAAVGSFAANGFGLHDAHGNVWEWCRDWNGEYGSERPGDGLQVLTYDSANRVNRGGGFNNPAVNARSGVRGVIAPSIRGYYLGLRPARTSRL